MEVWKDIQGYNGNYQVSDCGHVRSMSFHRTGETKVLKINKHRNGYFSVLLFDNGKRKRLYIHRLVAEAFIPNPFNFPQVNHKDEDKSNNHVDNLEWCTAMYNSRYGTGNKRKAEALSKAVNQYTLDGTFVKTWDSVKEVKRAGFSNVRRCIKGITHQCKGYVWRFA